MVILYLVLISVLTLILYIFSLKLYWIRKKVRSLVIFPIIATLQMFSLKMSVGDFLWNIYNKSGPFLVGFHICGAPGILIKDLEVIKAVLIKDFENFNHRTVGINYEGDPLGTRILFSLRNPSWTLMRKKVSASFTSNRLRTMYPAINTVADNLVEYIEIHQGESLETKETFHKFSTDVITFSAFGMDANCFKNDDAISRVIAREVFKSTTLRGIQFMCFFIAPYFAKMCNMKFIEQSGGSFVEKIVAEIKEFRDKNDAHKRDFVGRILEMDAEKVYIKDRSEILAQALQFWIAGFETIGSSLLFLFHELSHHPEIQDRLRKEIRMKLKENNGEISYETIRHITYLNMVTTETFRKYPVLPFIDRVCINDYKIPDTDITIDGGTNVYVSIQGLHYDPELFPDPYKFDPERFHPDNKMHEKFQYLTFGEGPRHCIGMRFGKISVLVAAAKVISKFKIIPTNAEKNVEFDGRTFLLSPKKLIHLKFELADDF